MAAGGCTSAKYYENSMKFPLNWKPPTKVLLHTPYLQYEVHGLCAHCQQCSTLRARTLSEAYPVHAQCTEIVFPGNCG